jgi:lipoprotein-releasing system ATP-binding protein
VLRHPRPRRGARRNDCDVGASGVGKSTLLHVLGGLDAVDGVGSARRRRRHSRDETTMRVSRFRNRHVGSSSSSITCCPSSRAQENIEMPLFIAGNRDAERTNGRVH